MPIEKPPARPLSKDYVPANSRPYRVRDGDSWVSVAGTNRLKTWDLILFNFKTRDPAEVNWYLRRNVGCNRPTRDGKNWMFSRTAKPGIIHIPVQVTTMPPMVITAKAPSKPSRLWAGLGKSHSGDFFVIGAFDLTAKSIISALTSTKPRTQ